MMYQLRLKHMQSFRSFKYKLKNYLQQSFI